MVRRIAVLRALYLGDFLCAEPALRALKDRYPLADLYYIGLPWIEPLLRRYDSVSAFWPFPGCAGIAEVPHCPERTEAFLAQAQQLHLDLAVQMHGSGPESNDFVASLGARVSLGYTPDGEASPLTLAAPYPGDHVHETRKWLALVAHVGATAPAQPRLPILPEEEQEAADLLRPLERARPAVALHVGSRDTGRRWQPERFAALANQLWDTYGCQIVLTGSPDDAPLTRAVQRACHAPLLDLTGRTSVGTLAALLQHVNLLVTNDSGPSHVAWACGVPSVVLFGPTDPARWAPLNGTLHRAVISPSRRLQDLSLQEVWSAVTEQLKHKVRQHGGRGEH
ncbi:MAG: glycosyltransferase family 9 protein [Anaerolineae bacterium]